MRKLLVKLVAAETALLGWLSYWLFLVYADNPTVSQGLSTQLSRFPQISYTTIDISIVVIIAIFSILLAIKFDRGLRPGMKLERALQMLENLMKRNLFLESQLAEFRGDKLPASGLGSTSSVLPPPSNTPPSQLGTELLQSGSWERAFRTPIEAGPSNAKMIVPTSQSTPASRPPSFEPGPRLARPPNIEPPFVQKDEKSTSQINSNWQDSPARTMETRGIIIPSQPPSAKKPILQPPPSFGTSSTTRLPYIPVPAPRAPLPSPGPIVGAAPKPTLAVPTPLSIPKPGLPAQARPITKPLVQTSQPQTPRTSSSLQPLTTLTAIGPSSSPPKAQVEQPQTALPKTTTIPQPQSSTIPAKSTGQIGDGEEDQLENLDENSQEDEDEANLPKKDLSRKDKASLFDEDSD